MFVHVIMLIWVSVAGFGEGCHGLVCYIRVHSVWKMGENGMPYFKLAVYDLDVVNLSWSPSTWVH